MLALNQVVFVPKRKKSFWSLNLTKPQLLDTLITVLKEVQFMWTVLSASYILKVQMLHTYSLLLTFPQTSSRVKLMPEGEAERCGLKLNTDQAAAFDSWQWENASFIIITSFVWLKRGNAHQPLESNHLWEFDIHRSSTLLWQMPGNLNYYAAGSLEPPRLWNTMQMSGD